jgi:outer membrane immunogenic protein
MKTIFAAAIAAALLSGTAYAADLVVYDEPVAVMSSEAFDWTGFYVGINAGYGGGTFEHPFEITDGGPLADGSIDVTAGGFLYGVQAGANWQMDNILLGIEGDIQGSTIDGRVSLDIDFGGPVIAADAGTSLDWLATLRPRIGFVNDQFVVYATGGLAFGDATSSVTFELGGPPTTFEETTSRLGYTVGAGIEYALTENITFKTEYLYTDLGTETVLEENLLGADVTLDSSVAFHTVRAGLNFLF